MIRSTLGSVMVLLLASLAGADDKEEIAKLRKEIVDLRAQLAAKEEALAKLDPVEVVPFLFANKLKVGTAGPFGVGYVSNGKGERPAELDTFNVVKVIDEHRAVVKAVVMTEVKNGVARHTSGEFILFYPTKGLADGAGVKPTSRAFRVTGTDKFNDKTYYTVEPYSLPPSAKK